MDKDRIVKALIEIAELLEITDASRFEFQAFRNAASSLDDWSGDLEEAVANDSLVSISGVGKGTSKVIGDLYKTGNSEELARVRGLVPDELPHLLRFRGLGPKRVKTLWNELGITGPDDLEKAIQNGGVQNLKGFGPKMIEKMQDSLEYFRGTATEKPLPKLSDVPQAVPSTGKIFAGTSGYSYPQWKGSFFPAKAKTDDLLRFYAEKLNTVEINNTFYRFPSEKVVTQWKTQTPEDFQFSLKVHRRVTHQMRLNSATKIRIQEFVDRCSVLQSRLGCILFQLPPDFERDDERLDKLLDAIPAGPRYSIEFRHPSWFDDAVFSKLESKDVACVSGDSEDQPPGQFLTASFVYVRLRKTAYSADELDEWNQWFSDQRAAKRDVLVYLKHDETGSAPIEIEKRWMNDR